MSSLYIPNNGLEWPQPFYERSFECKLFVPRRTTVEMSDVVRLGISSKSKMEGWRARRCMISNVRGRTTYVISSVE